MIGLGIFLGILIAVAIWIMNGNKARQATRDEMIAVIEKLKIDVADYYAVKKNIKDLEEVIKNV